MLSDVTVTSILEIEQTFKKESCSNIILSHSEISGQIYAYINNEKHNITKEAIEAVQAIKVLEQTKLKLNYNSVKPELKFSYSENLNKCDDTTKNCEFCTDLYKGDTLYQATSWDGGIGFDYIYMNFCPICGRKLEKEGE